MANLKKIQHYLILINQLHLKGIYEPAEILKELLTHYISEKKEHNSYTVKTGVLFGNNAPHIYAKGLLKQFDVINTHENLIFTLSQINKNLTKHFKLNHYKKSGSFASMWIAFIHYYHPLLPELESNSFFKDSIIIGKLINEKKQANYITEFLKDVTRNDYYRSFIESNRKLINVLKICGTSWIQKKFRDQVIEMLTKIPFWDTENIETCRENTLVAISTLQQLVSEDKLQSVCSEILSNLAEDIDSIHYRTLFSISKIPFHDVDDKNIITNLVSAIDYNYAGNEYEDEDPTEYRSCTILEILLKITKDKQIHDIIYNKISKLLDSDQDNSVEKLLKNISIPEEFKRVYIDKLLDNLKNKRRRRYDTTKILNCIIEQDEDKTNYFHILLDLIERKHCLNAISAMKEIKLDPLRQTDLIKTVIRLLRSDSTYLGVEIIRATRLEYQHKITLLNSLKSLINEKNPCAIIDAMRYLPYSTKDNEMMINRLLSCLSTENEFYSILLFSKIPIPPSLASSVIIALASRAASEDDLISCEAIFSLSKIHAKVNIFDHLDSDWFIERIHEKLSNPKFSSCIEKICLALPSFGFSTSYCNNIHPLLLTLMLTRDPNVSNAAIHAFTHMTASLQFKYQFIESLLQRINNALSFCHFLPRIIEDINILLSYISKGFSIPFQIRMVSLIETKLADNLIVADYIISELNVRIKTERRLNETIPTEIIKHVFNFT